MKLLIVESPSKAKTIEKYLKTEGSYVVRSSVGHIRDLPKSSKDAIDMENGYKPNYIVSSGKQSVIAELIKQSKKADEILLATDLDREGEAIAWHLEQVITDELKKKTPPMRRITFNAITKASIVDSLKKPRDIDNDLRKAQEARRVLDRLVGYDLSGIVWKKVRYGLSAGRVQSPALRIIMEKERTIRAFIPEKFWVLEGDFAKSKNTFTLSCDEEPKTQERSDEIVKNGKRSPWIVSNLKESDAKRSPKAPFTTSTLQQAASTRLGLSPSRTMQIAQKLYEGGHITYMRTDSVALSKEALIEITETINKEFGEQHLEIKAYKNKSKNAQEAHEAIRPTHSLKIGAGSNELEKRLYKLIWMRTVSSQMKAAGLVRTKLIASSSDENLPTFSANASRVIYAGWLLADPKARSEDTEVPKVSKGDALEIKSITSEEKETQPPNRYSEAGLVKELEKRGIGRPSTYASIMKTLVSRGYVTKEGRTLIPTDTGDVVSSFLEKHFAEYISDGFTAEMENQLDEVATGKDTYIKTVDDYYRPLHAQVLAKDDIPKVTTLGDADPKFKCPECEKKMILKLGRTGIFLSCSTYPDCEGALTKEGHKLGEGEEVGVHPETGKMIYMLSGKFGPYVQIGKKDPEDKKHKPKRASVPKDISPEEITLDQAIHLLVLPRDLGAHPESGEMIISNIGRFGPYVGHGREFRSLKKGDDPYTVTVSRAVEILAAPKALPKGVKLVCVLGNHPKTGKEMRVLESKSGRYLQKGLKRIYLPDEMDPKKMKIEEAIAFLKAS